MLRQLARAFNRDNVKARKLLVAGQDSWSPRHSVDALKAAPLERWLEALGFADEQSGSPTILGAAAGLAHSLVAYRTANGTERVLSMGRNDVGQLGVGFSSSESTRGHVEGFEGEHIVGLAAGNASSLLLVRQHDSTSIDTNRLYAFGSKMRGQLGLEPLHASKGNERILDMACRATEVPIPSSAEGLPRHIVSISAGFEHVVALCDDGTLLTTGANPDGQLGTADLADRGAFTEVKLSALQRHDEAALVSAGADTTAFLTESGLLFTFGNSVRSWLLAYTCHRFQSAQEYGQALHGHIFDTLTRPRFVDWHRPIRQVAMGGSFSILLDDSGQVYAAGYGALGLGPDILETLAASRIPILDGASSIYAAYNYAAAIKDGQLYVWGLAQGQTGRLGFGPKVERLAEPTLLRLPPGFEHAIVVDAQLGGENIWITVEDDP